MSVIYLDAATTLAPNNVVIERAQEFLENSWGNVSGGHAISRKAKSKLESAREEVANVCGVQPDNIVFTSGATDALNIVIQGFARNVESGSKSRILCSNGEHDAVKKTCDYLGDKTIDVINLDIDSNGSLILDQLDAVNAGDLVCVMAVSNETGIIYDIEAISNIVRQKGAFLLIDAVQSYYAFEASAVCELADYIVFSGHKLGGLQGVGMLVIKDRKSVVPLMFGGSQEWELRPGTTPAYLCDSFAGIFASKYESEKRKQEIEYVGSLREKFETLISKAIDNIEFNSGDVKRSAHVSSVRFNDIESQLLVTMLDENGVCVSKGSACASGASTPSRVLTSMGLSEHEALSTIRASFSSQNSETEIVNAVEKIVDCVNKLRSFSSTKEVMA
jgi:cysteine desulfurase